MSMGLTQKQRQLLDYLTAFQATRGYCPSYEEMMRGVGLNSKGGIHRLVSALIERGKIRRPKNGVRNIEIVDGAAAAPSERRPVVTIKISGDGYYVGADQRGEVEVRLERV
jgi:SOS-response transcriptional repressor LexA